MKFVFMILRDNLLDLNQFERAPSSLLTLLNNTFTSLPNANILVSSANSMKLNRDEQFFISSTYIGLERNITLRYDTDMLRVFYG